MKAVIYAVRSGTKHRAYFSIAWDVDKGHWTDRADEMIRLREPVPLGKADVACGLLNERWEREEAIGSGIGPRKEGGANSATAGRDWVELFRETVRTTWRAERTIDSDLEVERVRLGSTSRNGTELAEAARLAARHLAGRSLLREEATQLLAGAAAPRLAAIDPLAALQYAALDGALQLTAAVAPKPAAPPQRGFRAWVERLSPARLFGPAAASPRRAEDLACRRCGSGPDKLRRTACAACGQACAYCEACLTMGRSRECGLLIIGASPIAAANLPLSAGLVPRTNELTRRWGLSLAQSDAAAQALLFLNTPHAQRDNHAFLLWAVTGAGKTEMIFPLLDAVLARGGRALVATPRKDVVLELEPRLAKAFPNHDRVVLYGGSANRWESGQLTLATTHQLLRFQGAFDLVLVDELDAFPYHNDPMLHFAAEKCRNRSGCTLYLSATPPLPLQRAVSKGKLPCARVPVRYHRHPLPVPRRLSIPAVDQMCGKQRLPEKLLNPLLNSIRRGAQIFVFVPYVKQVEPLVNLFKRHAPQLNIESDSIAGTSSKDAERTEKVISFRGQTVQLLVTTTILERGVTIPKSDVYILDGHNRLFDAASLVQMSGRAGRSAADPCGFVYFGAPMWTLPQRNSIRQIREMNKLAKRQGYID